MRAAKRESWLRPPDPLVKMARQCFLTAVGPSQTTHAIILRSRPYGESDKIVTFLSDDAGKLTGIAKGAKNSKRRFANCLDPFTRVRVHYRSRPGAGMVFMESCDLLRPPGSLSDPTKFAYGSYLIELLDQLTAEAQPVGELYTLLAEGLDALEQGAATATFLRAFELQLLYHAGYDPELHNCGACHQPLLGVAQAFLDPMQGHLVCAACRPRAQALLPLSGATLSALDGLKKLPLHAARQQRFSPTAAAEAAQVMTALLALHLPRPLRSVKLIAELSRR